MVIHADSICAISTPMLTEDKDDQLFRPTPIGKDIFFRTPPHFLSCPPPSIDGVSVPQNNRPCPTRNEQMQARLGQEGKADRVKGPTGSRMQLGTHACINKPSIRVKCPPLTRLPTLLKWQVCLSRRSTNPHHAQNVCSFPREKNSNRPPWGNAQVSGC